MATSERVIEISRNRAVHAWKLIFGSFFMVIAIRMMLQTPTWWVGVAVFGALGVPSVVRHALTLVERKPRLFATGEGVWFGSGPIVPWSAIRLVYEAASVRRHGLTNTGYVIGFAFHRTRTLFRLPPWLWFTTVTVGDLHIRVHEVPGTPLVQASDLDMLREASVGRDSGVRLSSMQLPAARVVRRAR